MSFVASLLACFEEATLPNFTIRLQTSPGKDVGESVNSLPPLKSPQEPLISGDTVPPTWTVEVPTTEEVNKLLDKKVEELNARISRLEDKLRSFEEDFHKGLPFEDAQTAPRKPSEEKHRASSEKDDDKNVQPNENHDKTLEHNQHKSKDNSAQQPDSEEHADKKRLQEAGSAGATHAAKTASGSS